MNRFIVSGNLGKDPLTKSLNDGKLVCEFSLAERVGKDQTQWHNVKCFGKTAEFADKHLAKGLKVIIEGRIVYRQWEDRDGKRKYATEVIAEKLEPIQWKSDSDNSHKGGGSLDDIEF